MGIGSGSFVLNAKERCVVKDELSAGNRDIDFCLLIGDIAHHSPWRSSYSVIQTVRRKFPGHLMFVICNYWLLLAGVLGCLQAAADEENVFRRVLVFSGDC